MYRGHKKTSACEKLLLDTHEAWYWIGFLLADGHIKENKIELSLHEKDKEHMQKFANFIEYIYELKYVPNRKQYTMNTSNKEIAEAIRIKFDFSHRKTYEPPNFEKININDDLFLCLFSGFVDGDGTILNIKNRNCKKIKIRCHANWLTNLKYFENFIFKYFNKSNKTELTEINEAGKSSLVISRTDILKGLYDKVIEFNLPVLYRKWDKLKTLKIANSDWTDEEDQIITVAMNNLMKFLPERTWDSISQRLKRINPMKK
jgi:hypothetical protein